MGEDDKDNDEDGEEKDEEYGSSVAISGDGNIIGVGAPSGDSERGFVGAYAY